MRTAPDMMITPQDLAVLEAILSDPHFTNARIRQAIRARIASARIVLADDMPLNIATIGARIRFQVDNLAPDERILVKGAGIYPTGTAQCITTPRGIALLGLAEGTSINVADDAGSEVLHIISVLYQPEAARRTADITHFDINRLPGTSWPQTATLPTRPAGAPFWDDDDPGPTAA